MLNRVAGFNLDDMILLNQLQIKKRKGLFDESDTEKLNSIMSTVIHARYFSANQRKKALSGDHAW